MTVRIQIRVLTAFRSAPPEAPAAVPKIAGSTIIPVPEPVEGPGTFEPGTVPEPAIAEHIEAGGKRDAFRMREWAKATKIVLFL